MKFAKELEQDLVPEWRIKYLDYKAGKKHVKAVASAAKRMNQTPRSTAQQTPLAQDYSTYGATSTFPRKTKPSPRPRRPEEDEEQGASLRDSPAPLGADSRPDSDASEEDQLGPLQQKSPAIAIPAKRHIPELSEAMRYGSFVPTPPTRSSFELPGPALTPGDSIPGQSGAATPPRHTLPPPHQPASARSASMAMPASAYEVGRTMTPSFRKGTFANLRNRFQTGPESPFLRRVFSVGTPLTPADTRRLDMDLVVIDQVRQRQREFFKWMDKELDKVETFYKSKEDEAGARLTILREQLHEMRNRRIEEVATIQHAKSVRKEDENNAFQFPPRISNGQSKKDDDYRPNSRDHLKKWFDPLERAYDQAKAKITGPHPGANSKALQKMQDSPEIRGHMQAERNRRLDAGRDYVRRPYYNDEVPYRTAKRKLKLALQEFYRGMELLKSYALLNRTAFRKINKKYDKAINAHPPLRYMSEKVNKAWFVQSEVLDGHLHDVEDLYARYFERGNHKIATGKLRGSQGKRADQSASAFKNGLLIGIGAVFAIQGVIYGAELLYDPDPIIHTQTSYLMQIYAGYFLALYLFAWFCLDCSIWTRNKINYQFVFEFDPRSNLDWRELSEFPSFLILVLGLFVWLNFTRYGLPEMYIYYPVILIFLTAVMIFLPAPIFFHRSRRWFVYSHWRLLLAGLYPVEFRDFFLGDMYCSLTYFMSNIELFFCLYATHWSNPSQCNSTHSRLLGFFSTLPGIWRALQCLRRYYDTQNIFPHLVNCGKYSMTIAYYVTLSIYRINHAHHNLAIFITFATINAVYCSIWDLLMDWSLLQPHARKRFLRDVRGYKEPHWYYLAMALDPILRFNWIFYAIYTQDLQHSTLVSFLVAFSEVSRRGMWVLFRVENEHCANVARFKASRDVPLPYSIPTASEEDFERRHQEVQEELQQGSATTTSASRTSPAISRLRSHTGASLEAQESAGSGSSVRRRPQHARTFTMIVADAHTQDFEKKRKPGTGDGDNGRGKGDEDEREVGSSDEEEDEEEDARDVADAEEMLRERGVGGGGGVDGGQG